MFQRFHAMKEEREGGFTLIELLVVILIIAILAAIAIPVFLRQREKGWRSQLVSALKNAATAEESYLTTSPDDSYTDDVNVLVDEEGLKMADGVAGDDPAENISITVEGGEAFCIEGQHNDLDDLTMAISSSTSEPTEGTCGTNADGLPDVDPA